MKDLLLTWLSMTYLTLTRSVSCDKTQALLTYSIYSAFKKIYLPFSCQLLSLTTGKNSKLISCYSHVENSSPYYSKAWGHLFVFLCI